MTKTMQTDSSSPLRGWLGSPLGVSLRFLLLALCLSLLLSGLGQLAGLPRSLLVLLHSSGVLIAVVLLGRLPRVAVSRLQVARIALGMLLPVAYVGILVVVQYAIDPGVFKYAGPASWLSIVFSVVLVALSAYCEEVGWRFHLPAILSNAGWLRMNVIIGLIWAAWHYPAALVGAYTLPQPLWIGLPMFTLNVVLLSIMLGWLNGKVGTILAPTFVHTTHNLSYDVAGAFMTFAPSSSYVLGEGGFGLTITLSVVILCLRAWKRPIALARGDPSSERRSN